ncbi:MAG: hypothetical protein HOH69_02020 [Gammaproteobacteria bacterium]|nr:hypothetical protein [Gammaproteobacteria bacterium]
MRGQGLDLKESSIVDASIIAIPISTENKESKHDAAMHQIKKGAVA